MPHGTARSTTSVLIRFVVTRIPGILLGILVFFPASAFAQIELARELLEEGDWVHAARECERVIASDGRNDEASLLLQQANLRLGRNHDDTESELKRLATTATQEWIRAVASCEAGRLLFLRGEADEARDLLTFAFYAAPTRDVYVRSGYMLDRLLNEQAAAQNPDLMLHLKSSEGLWTRQVREACAAPGRGSSSIFSRPGQLITSFYRKNISPAIGSRCALSPSCSEYFRQASIAHGLLAFPIIGDRLVREPSIVKARESPIVQDGQLKFRDPLCDHTFWRGTNGK